MKAAFRRAYCSPEQIKVEAIEKPIPKDDEVLIRVHFSTVNRTDCANLTAKPFIMRLVLGLFKPRQPGLGTEYAGEIVALGESINGHNIGNRVFGFNDLGLESQAEYLTTTADNVFSIPGDTSFKQAAASLEGAHYAYSFIHKVKIQPGQRILINGATGGIGSALLQMVKQFDVKITATCDTKNCDLIRSLGADKVIDYLKEDFTEGKDKYDFVFDAVGKSTFSKCRPLLNSGGVYISSEPGPYFQNVYYPLLTLLSSKKVIFPIPFSKKVTIPYIKNLLELKKFNPIIDREYPLQGISRAYDYVMKGQKMGNVLINVIDERP